MVLVLAYAFSVTYTLVSNAPGAGCTNRETRPIRGESEIRRTRPFARNIALPDTPVSTQKAQDILNKAGWVMNSNGVMEKKGKKGGTQTLEFSIATADS